MATIEKLTRRAGISAVTMGVTVRGEVIRADKAEAIAGATVKRCLTFSRLRIFSFCIVSTTSFLNSSV